MDIRDKVAVVTGGASGIGSGMARRFAAEGARGLARDLGNVAMTVRCNVSREAGIQTLVDAARPHYGQVDIYMSNAGIPGRMGGFELGDPLWDQMWQIHGMAHVWAARAVVPEMVAAEVVRTMHDEHFLVLPHPQVLQYFRNKGQDDDRWIGGLQKLYARHAQAGQAAVSGSAGGDAQL